MFCRNCGHTLRASGEPCLNCGTPSGFGYARHSYTSAQMPFIPFDADPDALFSRTRYRPSDGIYAPQKSQTPPAIMNMPAPLAQYSFESEPIRRAVKKDAEWGMAKETEPEEKWADAPAEPEKEAMLGEVWHENGFAMVGMLSRKAKRSLVKGDKKGTRQLNPITLVAIFAIVALVCIAAFSLISGRLNANEFTRTRENMTRTLRAFDETAYRDAFVSEYQINPRQAIVNFDSKGSFEAFTRSYTSDLRLMTLQNAASGIRAAIKNTLINQAEAAKGVQDAHGFSRLSDLFADEWAQISTAIAEFSVENDVRALQSLHERMSPTPIEAQGPQPPLTATPTAQPTPRKTTSPTAVPARG